MFEYFNTEQDLDRIVYQNDHLDRSKPVLIETKKGTLAGYVVERNETKHPIKRIFGRYPANGQYLPIIIRAREYIVNALQCFWNNLRKDKGAIEENKRATYYKIVTSAEDTLWDSIRKKLLFGYYSDGIWISSQHIKKCADLSNRGIESTLLEFEYEELQREEEITNRLYNDDRGDKDQDLIIEDTKRAADSSKLNQKIRALMKNTVLTYSGSTLSLRDRAVLKIHSRLSSVNSGSLVKVYERTQNPDDKSKFIFLEKGVGYVAGTNSEQILLQPDPTLSIMNPHYWIWNQPRQFDFEFNKTFFVEYLIRKEDILK